MSLTYDLFWSFCSPYSYLVTPRLLELERDFDVKANVRPVYPIIGAHCQLLTCAPRQ